jgi:hypothetical protein
VVPARKFDFAGASHFDPDIDPLSSSRSTFQIEPFSIHGACSILEKTWGSLKTNLFICFVTHDTFGCDTHHRIASFPTE